MLGIAAWQGCDDIRGMRQVSLEIGDTAEQVLTRLASWWGMTPGRVVELLCQSVDRELVAELSMRLIDAPRTSIEPGIARMPERRRTLRPQ
jgi:hypothetical protein